MSADVVRRVEVSLHRTYITMECTDSGAFYWEAHGNVQCGGGHPGVGSLADAMALVPQMMGSIVCSAHHGLTHWDVNTKSVLASYIRDGIAELFTRPPQLSLFGGEP